MPEPVRLTDDNLRAYRSLASQEAVSCAGVSIDRGILKFVRAK